jgi:hypothetical protein
LASILSPFVEFFRCPSFQVVFWFDFELLSIQITMCMYHA